ncbi:LytTR family DNA-binding domain-containing protein [uncultured Duncaniella sp.]|uniref:LytR/AlgR family response regulator transcription factor n=1 Tax=uncultured Duncaniella sp. TaxID=2768039 RepID=UPI0025FE1504|nr:LytTR family DNA-binding domain-containing protein [uncultured Duncaniella sp.]
MSDKIRCIAIDDEPLALEIIKKFCERAGDIELQTYSDPEAGLAAIREGGVDLAFLDIEMEGTNGLAIAGELPVGTCFIFTTAYLDYALDGFNLDAIDYLHKPFSYDRFLTALGKARRRIEYAKHERSNGNIIVKQEYNNITIPLNDIIYVEAMEGYSKIFRTGGVCTVSRVILKSIGAMLPANKFVRIHRSYIVAVDKITGFTRQNVTLESGVTLPVGRQYSAVITQLLNKH